MTPLVYIAELVEDDATPVSGVLSMDRAIQKLGDEITGVNMKRHRGKSRELMMVLTKLQEARQWAIAYGESFGSHVILPKAEILRMAHADTTDTTDTGGRVNAV